MPPGGSRPRTPADERPVGFSRNHGVARGQQLVLRSKQIAKIGQARLVLAARKQRGIVRGIESLTLDGNTFARRPEIDSGRFDLFECGEDLLTPCGERPLRGRFGATHLCTGAASIEQ